MVIRSGEPWRFKSEDVPGTQDRLRAAFVTSECDLPPSQPVTLSGTWTLAYPDLTVTLADIGPADAAMGGGPIHLRIVGNALQALSPGENVTDTLPTFARVMPILGVTEMITPIRASRFFLDATAVGANWQWPLPPPTDTLAAGGVLHTNQYLRSANSAFFLIMQADGNLCIYAGSGPGDQRGFIWGSAQAGNYAPALDDYCATMQRDGFLAVYRGKTPSTPDHLVWKSQLNPNFPQLPAVGGSPCQAIMENLGLLMITCGDATIWDTPLVHT